MAGKAPLLLAMVLFAIGVSGLALSSAERARWGPFEPGSMPATQQVRVVDSGTPFAIPPLQELFTSRVETAVSSEPAPSQAVEAATPAATPAPPLRVYGISSDDGGVSAAAVSPTPPPVTIVNVATDGDETTNGPETAPQTPDAQAESPAEAPVAAPEDVLSPPGGTKPREIPLPPVAPVDKPAD